MCQSVSGLYYNDKRTSFPKRNGLIRNTSSIVLAEKKTEKNNYDFRLRDGSSMFSSGKQKEEKLHDYYVNHELYFGTLRIEKKIEEPVNCSSKVKLTDNTFSNK